MANVLIFDTDTKKVLSFKKSVNTPDYYGRDDVLINPALPDCALKYMKVENEKVVEITQKEKDTIEAEEQKKIADKETEQIENLEVSIKDAVSAIIKVVNKRFPDNEITISEVIEQIKGEK